MANSGGIGQLLIELGVNTAYMKEGFAEATMMTKKFGREMESSFRSLGQNTSELAAAFGMLGPAGAELAGALNLAGQAAGKMIKEFAGVSSTFGFAAAGAAGVTAAFASISLASIAMATHTAEQIKQMAESAMIAGMTTQEFTRFGYAAKQAGVSQEGFTSSMSRFGNKMAQAAQGNAMVQAEFKMMGVSVTDVSGKMRSMGDVLLDVSDWFAKTNNGATKNAAAMQIGGRGFKQMLPLLSEGREGFKKWADEADALGIVIDKNTADMATKYTQTITAIKSAGDGLAIQLTKELLPSLQGVASAIKEDLKSPDSDIKKFVEGIATIAKWFVDLVAIAGASLGEIGQFFKKLGAEAVLLWRAISDSAEKVFHRDFKGAAAVWKQESQDMQRLDAQFAQDSIARWTKVWGVLRGESGEAKTPGKPKTDAQPPNISKSGLNKETDETEKWIRHQQDALKAAIELAEGVKESVAAIEMSTAAKKSEEEIDKRIGDLQQKNREIDKALAEDAASEAPNKRAQAALSIQKESINKQIGELKRYRDAFKAGKEEEVALTAIAASRKALLESGENIKQQITDQQALNDAMKTGGESVYTAEATQKLKDKSVQLERARQLADAYATANANDVSGIKLLNDDLAANEAAYKADLKAEEALLKLNFQKKVDDETRALEQETQAILAHANALKLSAERQMEVKAAAETAKFVSKNPQANILQIAAEYNAQVAKGRAEIQASEITKANEFDVLHAYELQKKELDDIINDKNNSIGVQNAARLKEQEDQVKLRAGLDDMYMKSNDIGTVMLAWADKLAAELPKLGNDFAQDMVKAVDQFNSTLIGAIGTGKINFHSLLVSIAKDFATTALKGTEGLIASLATGQGAKGTGGAGGIAGVFGALFGKKGGEKGTQANPMITQDVNGGAGGIGGIAKGLGKDVNADKEASLADTVGGNSGGGMFGGIFSKLRDMMGGLMGKLGGIFGSMGGVFGKILGSLGGAFGGFLAGGGDVTPGKAYVVGEKHPEFFVPRASGTVVPTMKTGDGPKSYQTSIHFYGVTDADSFKRSQAQIMQGIGLGMSASLGRK